MQTLAGRQVPLPPRTASCEGYNLNAGVSVKGQDRDGLERLSRYLLRPPLARERLERRADGTVVIGLKRAWSDGTTSIELSASALTEKLAALIPPPRSNTIIYRGVLAGNAAWRKEVIPKPPEDCRAERTAVKLARGPRINEGCGASWSARQPVTSWPGSIAPPGRPSRATKARSGRRRRRGGAPQAPRRGRRERCERAERQARQAPQPAPGGERKPSREGAASPNRYAGPGGRGAPGEVVDGQTTGRGGWIQPWAQAKPRWAEPCGSRRSGCRLTG